MDFYRQLAAQTTAAEFASRIDHFFLVKRPSLKSSTTSSGIEYRTTVIATRTQGNKLEDDEFATSWLIEPILRKPGRPFPERVSLGRAKNCDIPLRAAYISKLHAYFVVETGQPMRLFDNKSANGTWVDGRRLDESLPAVVTAGSQIRLGALDLQVLDAAPVYELFRTKP